MKWMSERGQVVAVVVVVVVAVIGLFTLCLGGGCGPPPPPPCTIHSHQAVWIEDGTSPHDTDGGNDPCVGGALTYTNTSGGQAGGTDHCWGIGKWMTEYFFFSNSAYYQEYECKTKCENPTGYPAFCT